MARRIKSGGQSEPLAARALEARAREVLREGEACLRAAAQGLIAYWAAAYARSGNPVDAWDAIASEGSMEGHLCRRHGLALYLCRRGGDASVTVQGGATVKAGAFFPEKSVLAVS